MNLRKDHSHILCRVLEPVPSQCLSFVFARMPSGAESDGCGVSGYVVWGGDDGCGCFGGISTGFSLTFFFTNQPLNRCFGSFSHDEFSALRSALFESLVILLLLIGAVVVRWWVCPRWSVGRKKCCGGRQQQARDQHTRHGGRIVIGRLLCRRGLCALCVCVGLPQCCGGGAGR